MPGVLSMRSRRFPSHDDYISCCESMPTLSRVEQSSANSHLPNVFAWCKLTLCPTMNSCVFGLGAHSHPESISVAKSLPVSICHVKAAPGLQFFSSAAATYASWNIFSPTILAAPPPAPGAASAAQKSTFGILKNV